MCKFLFGYKFVFVYIFIKYVYIKFIKMLNIIVIIFFLMLVYVVKGLMCVDNDERIMNIFDRNGVVFIFVGVVNNGIKCLVKLLLKYYCWGSFVEKNIFKVLLIYGILIYYSCKIFFKGILFFCILLNLFMC